MPNQSLLRRLLTFVGIVIVGTFIFSFIAELWMFVFRFLVPIALVIGVIYLVNRNRQQRRY